jgi:hypothetical protein
MSRRRRAGIVFRKRSKRVMTTLSVAMCTFNGAPYLQEQLESISRQTRLPDELVVCDDRSQDETPGLLETFASKASFPVRLFHNEKNVGFTRNFERAIGLCQGDIIALSDQDDLWREDKLVKMEAALSGSTRCGAVFSDAEMVDQRLVSLGYSLWQSLDFKPSEQKLLLRGEPAKVLLKHNVVAGATLAFQAEFKDLVLPIPSCWFHDGWIALLIAATAGLTIIAEPLMKYRQHAQNQIGAIRKGFLKRVAGAHMTESDVYVTYIDQLRAVQERLLKHYGRTAPVAITSRIEAKISHLQARKTLPRQRLIRLPKVIRELLTLRYFRYSNGAESLVKDLFL